MGNLWFFFLNFLIKLKIVGSLDETGMFRHESLKLPDFNFLFF